MTKPHSLQPRSAQGRRRLCGALALVASLQPWVVGAGSSAAAAAEEGAGFDDRGVVVTDTGGSDRAYAVAVQPDGKLVVVGSREGDFLVLRYDLDGTLDETFGGDGSVTTAIVEGVDVATAVALDDRGRIVVAGYANGGVPQVPGDAFALARYLPDGTLERALSTAVEPPPDDGIETSILSRAHAVVVQPDGRIIAAGGTCRSERDRATAKRFALVRYRADLSTDPTFNGGDPGDSDGIVTTLVDSSPGCSADSNFVNAVAFGDDSIAVAGSATLGGSPQFAVARYTGAGVLDPSFDGDADAALGGQVQVTPIGPLSAATGVAALPDGKLLASGYAQRSDAYDFVAARYNPDGTLDEEFGGEGTGTFLHDVGGPTAADYGRALAVQEDGSSLLAGVSRNRVALVRLLPTGLLDQGFGTGGILIKEVGAQSEARGMTIAGCRIIAVGSTRENGRLDDVLAVRHLGAPSVATVDPAQGPATGGTRVSVRGDCLGAGTTVRFGDVEAPAVDVAADARTAVVTTPAHSAGTVPVTVTSVSGGPSPAPGAPTFTFTGDTLTGPTGGDEQLDGGTTTAGPATESPAVQQAAPPGGTGTGTPASVPSLSATPSPSPAPGLSANPAPLQAPSPGGAPTPAAVPVPTPGAASAPVQAPTPVAVAPPVPSATSVALPGHVPTPASSSAPLPAQVSEDSPGTNPAPAGGTGLPAGGGTPVTGNEGGNRFAMSAHENDWFVGVATGMAGIVALGGLVVACFASDSAARRRSRPCPQPQPA